MFALSSDLLVGKFESVYSVLGEQCFGAYTAGSYCLR